jgi:hypothetical protein
MSKEEQEAMELLRRNAIRTPNRYEGIKAVEALAEPNVKEAAKSEIDRIKKEAKS